jgi:NAD(P)-dependent dehydrogenase (short-subunit alcohol dehydrogenase family)
MLQLAGSTAFVTGAASGIGLAIARALVAEGSRVALADVDQNALDAAAEELGEAAMAIVLDVTDRPGWALAKDLVEAKFGHVDILVNNAGIGPDLNRLDEMPPERFDRLIAIKLTGTFNGIHTFVPGMKSREHGHVVNTASMAGLIASAKLGAYTASKFAVVGMTEVLRAELAGSGVSASVLCPGLVATNLGETTRKAGVQRAGKAPGTAGGIDPAQVGALVVQGIREDWLHIITHGEYRSFVAERSARILAAFDRAPNRSQDSLPPGTDVARN